MLFVDWACEQRRIYFGNASSIRDYRSQLRGIKAAVLWASYLAILITFALMNYAGSVEGGEQSIAVVQSNLKGFYVSVMTMLEIAVFLVAPVVVGLSIQSEVNRRAIDLVVTAPVTPKYYLVGKLISGFRTVVMLLFLSLPVAAAAIVLGGATWSEVLVSYCMVALHGLLYMAISLPIAILSNKVVPFVIYSYAACAAWSIGGGLFLLAMVFSVGPGSAASPHFTTLLFPGGELLGATASTELFGFQVPNWTLAALVILLVVRLFLLGAGSAMTRYGSKETASLRIHGLLYQAAFSYVVASAGAGPMMGSPSSSAFGLNVFVSQWTLIFIVPFLACWSPVEEKKCQANGFFSLKHALTAAPEGGLPYLLLLLMASSSAALVSGSLNTAGAVESKDIAFIIWMFAGWLCYWSIGWIASSFNQGGIGFARRACFGIAFLATVVPIPFLIYLREGLSFDFLQQYPPAAIWVDVADDTFIYIAAFEFLVLAAALALIGEVRRRSGVLSSRRIRERPAD